MPVCARRTDFISPRNNRWCAYTCVCALDRFRRGDLDDKNLNRSLAFFFCLFLFFVLWLGWRATGSDLLDHPTRPSTERKKTWLEALRADGLWIMQELCSAQLRGFVWKMYLKKEGTKMSVSCYMRLKVHIGSCNDCLLVTCNSQRLIRVIFPTPESWSPELFPATAG